MKLTIESTENLTHIDGVPVRIWNAKTESGIDCFVFVHRIAVHNDYDHTEFERELQEQLQPGRVIDLRYIL